MSDIETAARNFIQAWDGLAMGPFDASTLTCGEAEALADLFRAFGKHTSAESIMWSHSDGDEEGDDHYTGSEH